VVEGETYDGRVTAAVPERDAPPRAFAGACAALGDDLGWALGMLLRSYRNAAKQLFADLPGGPRGYQVLKFAAEEAPATQLALAQQLGIDRTVMTYLLDDLERAGLVERRADPADRRARRVVATEAGRDRLIRLHEGLREAEAAVLAPLPPQDAAAFRSLLQRLATSVEGVTPNEACEEVAVVGEAGPAQPLTRG
jgi:DNA-binding MarR family transcriptional regulator